jgi:hypothetical protein
MYVAVGLRRRCVHCVGFSSPQQLPSFAIGTRVEAVRFNSVKFLTSFRLQNLMAVSSSADPEVVTPDWHATGRGFASLG